MKGVCGRIGQSPGGLWSEKVLEPVMLINKVYTKKKNGCSIFSVLVSDAFKNDKEISVLFSNNVQTLYE